MQKKTLLIVGFALAISACAAQSSDSLVTSRDSRLQETSSHTREFQACRMDQDVRRVWIQESRQGGCRVMYEKHQSTEAVAEARWDSTHCHRVKERVVSNLSSAGYQCGQQQEAVSSTDFYY